MSWVVSGWRMSLHPLRLCHYLTKEGVDVHAPGPTDPLPWGVDRHQGDAIHHDFLRWSLSASARLPLMCKCPSHTRAVMIGFWLYPGYVPWFLSTFWGLREVLWLVLSCEQEIEKDFIVVHCVRAFEEDAFWSLYIGCDWWLWPYTLICFVLLVWSCSPFGWLVSVFILFWCAPLGVDRGL